MGQREVGVCVLDMFVGRGVCVDVFFFFKQKTAYEILA